MQKTKHYRIDLTTIEGRGEFKCPKCGVEISPDDKTEKTYTILESIINGENLEKIIIQCNNCKSQIHLTGFQILKEK
jgi:predicted nucleic-acid-binding Zn-ribbon protein